MLTMIEEEQPILSSLLEAREELYQRGTQFIFEALEPVLDSITSYLEIDRDAVEWAGVEKISDYVIIAGVVHGKDKAGRAIRVGMPIHIAEKGDKEEIFEFLKNANTKMKVQKAVQVSSTNNTSLDISKLSKNQIEKLTLSMFTVDRMDPTTKH